MNQRQLALASTFRYCARAYAAELRGHAHVLALHLLQRGCHVEQGQLEPVNDGGLLIRELLALLELILHYQEDNEEGKDSELKHRKHICQGLSRVWTGFVRLYLFFWLTFLASNASS